MEKAGDALNKMPIAEKLTPPAQPTKPVMRRRTVTITIYGPDSGPIVTGIASALRKIAASIMQRYKETAVSVNLSD